MISLKIVIDPQTGAFQSAEGIRLADANSRNAAPKNDLYAIQEDLLPTFLEHDHGFVTVVNPEGEECQLAYRTDRKDVCTVALFDLPVIEDNVNHLKEQYNRLDDISRSTGLGTWEWNVQTGETVFNERWAEIIGYSLDDLQPVSIDTWMSFAHPDDLEVSGKLLQDYWDGKTDQYICEARIKHKNGHWVWVIDIGKTITFTEDGKPEWMSGSHQDITERKESELLLESYKERLEQTNKVARIGSWSVNLITNLVEWSNLTREIHEIEEEVEIKTDDEINFYKPGYSRNRIIEVFEMAISNGEPYDEELQIITAKGNERWVRAIGIPRYKDGKCVSVHGVFQDIDKQKKTLFNLHESRERFKSTFENAPNGNALVNLHGQIIHANDRLAQLTGLERSKLSGKFLADLVELKYKAAIDRAFNSMAAGSIQEYNAVVNLQVKSGNVRYCMVGISVVEGVDRAPDQCIVQLNDITELRQTQTALESQIERLNSSEQVIIIEADIDGNILFFNHGAEKILGYTHSKVLEEMTLFDLITTVTWEEFRHELGNSDDDQSPLHLLGELANGSPDRLRECQFVSANREPVTTLLGIGSYSDPAGKRCLFLVATDISRQKQAEAELQDILNITRSQNDRLLSFAQIVSHNLRSHTSNLLLLLNLIKEQEPEIFDSKYLPMIDKATQGLDQTIKDLTQIVAINNDTTPIQDSVRLKLTLDKLQEQFRASIDKFDGEVNVQVDPEMSVIGSQAYVESILTNLLSNAIKYRAPGRPLIIDITAARKEDTVVVTFQDNGIGFDANKSRSKVFKLYQTFHRREDSRGVGLFITKNQIEQIGGSIEVESEPDKGTTFTLCFRSETGYAQPE